MSTAAPPLRSTLTFDPFAPGLVAQPFETYARLRADDPVHWCEPLQAWVLTRFADVAQVLDDRAFQAIKTSDFLAEIARRTQRDYRALLHFLDAVLFFKNGEGHHHDRRTIARVMNKQPLSQLEPEVRRLAAEHAAPLRDRTRYDALASFADPVPQLVMGHILGLTAADVLRLGELLAQVTLIFDAASVAAYDRINAGVVDAIALVKARIEEQAGTDSGLGMIHAGAAGTADEKLENAACTALFTFRVGAETTIGYLGALIATLAGQPGLRERLLRAPELVDRAAADVLRMESNVQRAGRIATAERIVGGQPIAAGQRVLLLIGAANRDPAAFGDPDAVLPEGRRRSDVAFGGGDHYCLGASLARLEGRVALETFLDLPAIEPDGEPTWYSGRTVRRMTSLPVRTPWDSTP